MSRPSARPSEERPEQRPEMLERPRDADRATKSFAELPEGDSTLMGLVGQPPHCSRGPALRDPQLEAAEVEPVANPVELDSPSHLGSFDWGAQNLQTKQLQS